jgi:hypothetical protein
VIAKELENREPNEILELAQKGQSEKLLKTLRARCMQSEGGLYYFAKVVLGYKDLVSHYHLPFCNKIQADMAYRRRGYLRPRLHFKSTIIAKSYPLWRICGGGSREGQPDPRNLRILIASESDAVASKNIKDPAWNIENNHLLRALFPEIIPADLRKVIWRDDQIELNRPNSFDESTLTAVGIGAKHTGFHYDVLIFDDPIGDKAAVSQAVMEAAKEWWAWAAGYANDPATVEELYVGTRWKHGKADLPGYIMEEMTHNDQQGARASGYKWDVEGCYDENGNARFWPRFSNEILADIHRRERTYKFSCNFLNQPSAPEGSKFTSAMIKTFHIEVDPRDNRKDLLVPSDKTSPVKLKTLARISFSDPASGGGKWSESEHAICCLGMASDGRKFVFKVWSGNVGFRQSSEQWFRMNDQFMCWPNYFEAIGSHKELATIIAMREAEKECSMCKKKHRRLNPVPITPPGGSINKDDRILTFCQQDFEEGRIYLFENDIETRNQILEFPNGTLNDRFDALAYACHLARRPHTAEELEEETVRVEKSHTAVQRTNQAYDVGGYI